MMISARKGGPRLPLSTCDKYYPIQKLKCGRGSPSIKVVQATTRTTEDGIPELTRIPEKIATTEHFILVAR